MHPGGNAGKANNLPPKAFERLEDMPPDRQEKFFQNNERFRNLPPDQQARIRQRLEAWNKLTPAQQQAFRERQRVWEQMTPDQRRQVQQTLLPRWRQLPPFRRQAIMQRLHQLRDLSEPERQSKLNDPSFVEGLNFETARCSASSPTCASAWPLNRLVCETISNAATADHQSVTRLNLS